MVTLVKVFGTGKKETYRGLKKSARTRTIKTSCELPAGAGKFPPVTRRNRRQSVPAEIFTCIRRYFYLRISLPAVFAFARASFTVYFINSEKFTLVKKTWKFSMLHRCLQAKFLIKDRYFREHESKIFTKHPCNMQNFPQPRKEYQQII